jgi:hypothetical protein
VRLRLDGNFIVCSFKRYESDTGIGYGLDYVRSIVLRGGRAPWIQCTFSCPGVRLPIRHRKTTADAILQGRRLAFLYLAGLLKLLARGFHGTAEECFVIEQNIESLLLQLLLILLALGPTS